MTSSFSCMRSPLQLPSGLICNLFRFACFVNSSLRFLIPNLHPICTCSCLFTPLTEGRSARDLTQAATSQKKKALGEMAPAPRTPGTPNAAPRVDFFRNTALEEGDDSQTQLVKILNSLHNVSFSQLLIQESMMRGQILALRAQEGHAKLIVNSIQKLVDSFQRIDPSQTAGRIWQCLRLFSRHLERSLFGPAG